MRKMYIKCVDGSNLMRYYQNRKMLMMMYLKKVLKTAGTNYIKEVRLIR